MSALPPLVIAQVISFRPEALLRHSNRQRTLALLTPFYNLVLVVEGESIRSLGSTSSVIFALVKSYSTDIPGAVG